MGFKYLVIVESRAKCAKIESLLGSNYKCVASLGHICELESGLSAIEIHNDFNPRYQIMPSKKKLVSELRELCQRAETVYLAADPDREGEAIAKDLAQYLHITKTAQRITFNEITKKAVQTAIKSPRLIDGCLCDAQKARRVLDRLVGFEISPILWQYVAKRLSAGRCQSPALEILYQREKTIKDFQAKGFYSITGTLSKGKGKGKGKGKLHELSVKTADKIDGAETCLKYLESTLLAKLLVSQVQCRDKTSNPPPPFTTSTLQQEASSRLSLNPKTTMQCAQRLYERGLITYMRTDSTCLSDEAKTSINKYVTENHGADYCKPRNYQSKQANAQEAHEAIRPVKVTTHGEDLSEIDGSDRRLYDLIWKRAIACQMSERRFMEQVVTVGVYLLSDNSIIYSLLSTEEQTTHPGYTCLYQPKESTLTPIKVDDQLTLVQLEGEERETKPKPRFTEASLVKEIERRGIGRPSTFSNIVTTLFDRSYARMGMTRKSGDPGILRQLYRICQGTDAVESVEVKRTAPSEKGKLFITELGESVRNFLADHFDTLLSDSFTSQIEERLDHVSNGGESWVTVVDQFYQSFHPTVVKLQQELGATGGTNHLQHSYGIKGKYEYKKIKTKYGLALARNITGSKSKAKYLPLVDELYGTGDTLQLDQVYQLFRFPKKLAFQEGAHADIHYGKNGFYLKWETGSLNLEGDYSLGQSPPADVLVEVLRRIENPDQSGGKTSKIIKKFNKLTVWNGKFGPFISKQGGRKTVSLPENTDVETLTEKSCLALFKEGSYRKPKK
jgi:DNA topoisomerase-1